ncbi:MAG: glycosyltransferase [Clostridiales bacterium]|nr:glycosyltransferase [Clostridiales bacterium]
MPAISVIIPVYNASPYLPQALDSILSQAFTDLEVICVDDGSTDGSRDILQDYAARDSRVQVLEQAHLTTGAARNRGLSAAQGDYVFFMDSDDFAAPGLLEHTYQAAMDSQADIVLFDGKRYSNTSHRMQENSHFLRYDLLPGSTVFSREEIPNDILRISNPAPWSKLFSGAYLRSVGLRFQVLPNTSDFSFVLAAMALANRICVVKEELVYTRINTKTGIQDRRYEAPLCFLEAVSDLYDLLNSRGIYEEIKQSFRHIAITSILQNLKAAQTDQVRWDILDALGREDIRRMKLFEPATDKGGFPNYVNRLAENLAYAIRQEERTKAAVDLKPPQLVVPCRAVAPVLVSVLIPVYNAALYVEQTLDSLVHQTLREIEIICINDGSTDDSLDILRKWAEKDPRILVYTQENMGPSRSRNVAMETATGDYLYFMDSDDWLEPDALEQLYARASGDRLDIVYFDAVSFFENEDMQKEHPEFVNNYTRSGSYDQVYDGPSLFTLFRLSRSYYPAVWAQCFRREFLRQHQLQFHVGVIHEDNAFSFIAILSAKRVSYIHKCFYHRRIRPNSIMTKSVTFYNSYSYFAVFMDMFLAFLDVESKLSQDTHAVAETLLCAMLHNAQDAYRKMPREQWDAELGLGSDYRLFLELVHRPADLQQRVSSNTTQLQEVSGKLKRLSAEKEALNVRLQGVHKEKAELYTRLQQADAEQAKLHARLQRTDAEKAELHTRLQQADDEKAELHARLQQADAEKVEQGVRIGELESQLAVAQEAKADLEAQLKRTEGRLSGTKQKLKSARQRNYTIIRSVSYRIGRILTWPVRKLRALIGKIR